LMPFFTENFVKNAVFRHCQQNKLIIKPIIFFFSQNVHFFRLSYILKFWNFRAEKIERIIYRILAKKNKMKLFEQLEPHRNDYFGSFSVDTLELVFNDWYQRKKKVKTLHRFKLE